MEFQFPKERKRPRGGGVASASRKKKSAAKKHRQMQTSILTAPAYWGYSGVKKHGKKAAKKFGNILSFGEPFK